jgi:hypothetical protein
MARRKFDAGQRATVLNLVGAPLAGIFRKYIIQQGFRDGMPGFILAGLHGYYTFLKYASLWELQNRPAFRNPLIAGRNPDYGQCLRARAGHQHFQPAGLSWPGAQRRGATNLIAGGSPARRRRLGGRNENCV